MNFCSDPSVKFRSLLLTALMRVPSIASNSRPEQIKAPAQKHEVPKHGFEGGAIDAAKIGDRLEIRVQAAQQPQDLDVTIGFGFQTPARSYPVQIAIDVELEKITRRVARTARCLRSHSRKTRCLEVKTCDKRIDKSNRMGGANIIVNVLR